MNKSHKVQIRTQISLQFRDFESTVFIWVSFKFYYFQFNMHNSLFFFFSSCGKCIRKNDNSMPALPNQDFFRILSCEARPIFLVLEKAICSLFGFCLEVFSAMMYHVFHISCLSSVKKN